MALCISKVYKSNNSSNKLKKVKDSGKTINCVQIHSFQSLSLMENGKEVKTL